MNPHIYNPANPPLSLWLDTGEQEDELEEAAREEKQRKKDGEPEEVDVDLERQERLNPRNRPH